MGLKIGIISPTCDVVACLISISHLIIMTDDVLTEKNSKITKPMCMDFYFIASPKITKDIQQIF